MFFWYQLPKLFVAKKLYISIRFFGCGAMLVGSLAFIDACHELAINMGGLLGAVAIGIAHIGFLRHRQFVLFTTGLLSLFCTSVNYYLYEFKVGIYYLPLLQKVSVAFFFLWVVIVNLNFSKQESTKD